MKPPPGARCRCQMPDEEPSRAGMRNVSEDLSPRGRGTKCIIRFTHGFTWPRPRPGLTRPLGPPICGARERSIWPTWWRAPDGPRESVSPGLCFRRLRPDGCSHHPSGPWRGFVITGTFAETDLFESVSASTITYMYRRTRLAQPNPVIPPEEAQARREKHRKKTAKRKVQRCTLSLFRPLAAITIREP